VARPSMIAGRVPDPSEPFEVAMGPDQARRIGVTVGDTFRVRALTGDEMQQVYGGGSSLDTLLHDPTFGEVVDLHVVGIGVSPADLISEAGLSSPSILMTPAYWERFDQPSAGWWGASVKLKGGDRDLAAFEDEVQALAPGETIVFQTQAATREKIGRTVRPYVVALVGFATVAAVLGLIVIIQAISRRSRLAAADQRVLQALGLGRTQRFAAELAAVLPSIVVGTIGAAVLGWLVSPVAPLGPVAAAEPAPGLMFDRLVLLPGLVASMVLLLALASIPIWRVTLVRTRSAHPRRSRAAQALITANAPTTGVIGVRFALESGSAAVPTRTVLIGASSAVALAVALLTFGASLRNFLDTPRLFGSDWNVMIDGNVSDEHVTTTVTEVAAALDALPSVEAHTSIRVSETIIDGTRYPALALGPSDRPVLPTITDGRAPSGANEIALGRATATALGISPGDPVTLTDPAGGDHPFTVSGIAVLPEVGSYPGSDKTSLGRGVLLDDAAFQIVAPDLGKEFVVARVGGIDPVGQVQAVLPPLPEGDWIEAARPPVPAEVTNLSRLRSTPNLLLGMLLLLLGAAVVHALLVAFRARRHDVAVLQALGYRPRQVMSTSLWQATTTAVVAVMIGAPSGIIIGRWVWMLLNRQLAAAADPITPTLMILALSFGVFVLVNGLGIGPGWRAGRRPPAETLRTE